MERKKQKYKTHIDKWWSEVGRRCNENKRLVSLFKPVDAEWLYVASSMLTDLVITQIGSCNTCWGIVAVTNVCDDFLVEKGGLCLKWPNVHLVLF